MIMKKIIPMKYLFQKSNTDKADPREKVLWFINNIMNNSKKYVKLRKDITIDETMVFLEADVL